MNLGANDVMDYFTVLPSELLPRLLMTPACEVAMRITCRRYHAAIKPGLFKKVAELLWSSDYWTLQIELTTFVKCICTQTGYFPGTESLADQPPPSSKLHIATYAWITGLPTTVRVALMFHEWGVIHVEDPAKIFHFVGKFTGATPYQDILDIISVEEKKIDDFVNKFDTCAVWRDPKDNRDYSRVGLFEHISMLMNTDIEVTIFRRR